MVSLELNFPGGRYHATPWGRHANEAAVEWPPSPWRILRAFVATWHLKARDEIGPDLLEETLAALTEQPPAYRVPRSAVVFHTRHYMPPDPDQPEKRFDGFVQLQNGDVVSLVWNDATLANDTRNALEVLADRLSYLGRAESWVQASVSDGPVSDGVDVGVAPGGDLPTELEIVPLLAPLPPLELTRWRQEMHSNRLASSAPSGLLTALQADPRELAGQGWRQCPPGARWVDYARPRSVLAPPPPALRRSRGRPRDLPTVARYALASQVPPRLTDALLLTDRLRRALMSRSVVSKGGRPAPVFSGKAEKGDPLRGHRHAFLLPEANLRDGFVSHVTVWAPMGFDDTARRALEPEPSRRGRPIELWQRGGEPLLLVLLGIGDPCDFAGSNLTAGQCPLFAEARVWMSRTPFLATRHPKLARSGRSKRDERGLVIGSPPHDLLRLLADAGFPEPTDVTSLSATELGGKRTRWLAFRTERRGGGDRGPSSPAGFKIEFPRPVRGPIALGYGAHFGLGLFVPERDD